MIRVCDAIMGTGKSSAAISYMNEHTEKKFIYITPYLDEAHRIATSCTDLDFAEPRKESKYNGSKTLHTVELVRDGRNVATTHRAFKYYPSELLDLIKEQHYTLIVDEDVDVLDEINEDHGDIKMAIDAGYIEENENGTYKLVRDEYNGALMREFFRLSKTREIVKVGGGKKCFFLYWMLPPDLITSFDDVFIMTYMFNGQSMHHFLEIFNMPYSYIWVEKSNDGMYRFSETQKYIPEYVKSLGDKIHILEHQKMNSIGDSATALSKGWFDRKGSDVEQLKNNIYNFFFNICKVDCENRMWGSFSGEEYRLRGKGYSKGFVTFNMRATNSFRDRTALAYCVNVYMNVGQKLMFQNRGVSVNEDDFALSTMVQWIWRSAIRDGRDIWLYIPSARMRGLLKNWIAEVSKY